MISSSTVHFDKEFIYNVIVLLTNFESSSQLLNFQIFEIKLESSVVEQLNVPKMIDKYPSIWFVS